MGKRWTGMLLAALLLLTSVDMRVHAAAATAAGVQDAQSAPYETAWFPAPTMYVSQIAYESYSHGGMNAIDIVPTGRVFAPFTGKIVKIDKNWGYVLLQSTEEVYYADGSRGYMSVGFMHDSNISDLAYGQVIKQGEAFYDKGGMGNGNPNAYGAHVQISVFRGQVSSPPSMSRGNVYAYDAFAINKNKTRIDGSSRFGQLAAGNHLTQGSNTVWKNLWRYTDSPAPTGPSTLAISGHTAPGNGNLKVGARWTCNGVVSSNYTITEVSGYILSGGGSTIAYSKTVNPNANSYSLPNGAIDTALLFNKLPEGTYHYQIAAKDASMPSAKVLFHTEFTVGNPAPPQPPAPKKCDFVGDLTSPANAAAMKAAVVGISAVAIDSNGIKNFTVKLTWNGLEKTENLPVTESVEDKIYICNYDISLPAEALYGLELYALCGGGISHKIASDIKFLYDATSPIISDFKVYESDGDYCYSASVNDNLGVSKAWMIVTDEAGGQKRFECGENKTLFTGTWSDISGLQAFGKYTIDFYAADAAGNLARTQLKNVTRSSKEEEKPGGGDLSDGLSITGLTEKIYTGSAITQDIKVSYNNILLIEGGDYTLSYKNNKNAGTATVTVTGQGNYVGEQTAEFKILKADIGVCYAQEFQVKASPQEQKPVPTLYYRGVKLEAGRDFSTDIDTPAVYAAGGTRPVTITGRGNFQGTRTITLTTVGRISQKPAPSIAKAKVEGLAGPFVYTGGEWTPACTLTLKVDGADKTLTPLTLDNPDGAYTVEYTNNKKAGAATVTFYGKNGFSGKLKKTFKIVPYDIGSTGGKITVDAIPACAYAKGGAKPKPVVRFDGKLLQEGIDYTLSYQNNTAAAGARQPTVTVKGKGNFKGRKTIDFQITRQDLGKMKLVPCDKIYKAGAANLYRISPKFTDLDGKPLSAGKDYNAKNVSYTYENAVVLENGVEKAAGAKVEKTDIIPAGTVIRVTLESGSGGDYQGTFTGTYRFVDADIKSARVTLREAQFYTGSPVEPDPSKITVTLGGVTLRGKSANLTEDYDYEITGYVNNTRKGTAYVILEGRGSYGGMKKAAFPIRAKKFR